MRELINEVRWRDHTFALVRFGLAVVFLIFCFFYFVDSRRSLIEARMNYSAQQSVNVEAEVYVDLLQKFAGDYVGFLDRGYVGVPRRLQWAESFREVAEELNLLGAEFTIEGSRLAEQNVDAFWHPDLVVRVTDMKVRMELTHEGSFYDLMTELASRSEGLFSIDHCAVRWLDDSVVEFRTTRFRGECNLRWFSVDDVTEHWRQGAM